MKLGPQKKPPHIHDGQQLHVDVSFMSAQTDKSNNPESTTVHPGSKFKK
jgi:hypothetical protein